MQYTCTGIFFFNIIVINTNKSCDSLISLNSPVSKAEKKTYPHIGGNYPILFYAYDHSVLGVVYNIYFLFLYLKKKVLNLKILCTTYYGLLQLLIYL